MRALVAWRGGLCMTEGEIGVLSVSALFLTRMGVKVGAGVFIRTRTYTLHIWGTWMYDCTYGVLGCKPRGWDETPGGPEKSRWTKSRHICIRIHVQTSQVDVYAMRRDEMFD